MAGGGGGGTNPATPLNSVQFNSSSSFGGSANLTFTDGNRLNVNKLGISGNVYDSNNSLGEGGMVLTNEGQTGVNWKSIESVLSGVGGSGVANYVARWSDEDTLTSGTIFDNGDVGIGTDNPQYLLEVYGDATLNSSSATTDATLRLEAAGATKWRIKNDTQVGGGTADTLTFTSAGAANVSINQAGAVGIGTNNPAAKLQVIGPNAVGTFFAAQNDGASGVEFKRVNAGSFPYNHFLFNNGYVGIGTTTPAKNLEVYAAAEPRIRVTAGADSNAGYEWAEGAIRKWVVYNENSTDNLQFKTNSNVRMVIAQGGNVGIGTDNPGSLLETSGTMRSTDYGASPTAGVGIEVLYNPSNERGFIYTYDRDSNVYKTTRIGTDTYFTADGNVGLELLQLSMISM